VFLTTLFVGGAYALLDAAFVNLGVWSFNEEYITGVFIGNLAIEECLFFFTASYASIFIYEVFKTYFRNVFSMKLSRILSIFFVLLFSFMLLLGYNKLHTLINCVIAMPLTIFITFIRPWKNLNYFYLSFFVSLIPFFLFDGLLAGLPVVFYNDQESLGRIMSIPYEDMVFNFSLLVFLFYFYDQFKRESSEERITTAI
jgi:lycopene cyclase domain-containing protein